MLGDVHHQINQNSLLFSLSTKYSTDKFNAKYTSDFCFIVVILRKFIWILFWICFYCWMGLGIWWFEVVTKRFMTAKVGAVVVKISWRYVVLGKSNFGVKSKNFVATCCPVSKSKFKLIKVYLFWLSKYLMIDCLVGGLFECQSNWW